MGVGRAGGGRGEWRLALYQCVIEKLPVWVLSEKDIWNSEKLQKRAMNMPG